MQVLKSARGVRMKICKLCKRREATSSEHIIPSALGGVLEARDVLCTKCNSTCGSSIDAKLVKALDWARMLLDIRGDRGQTATVRGHDAKLGGVILDSGGIPRPAERAPELIAENPDGSKIYRFSSRSAAQRFVDATRRKNPEADFKVSKATVISMFSEMVHMNVSLGGGDFYRSCTKSVLTLITYRGMAAPQITDDGVWRYVAGAPATEAGVRVILSSAPPPWQPGSQIGSFYHAISIEGDASRRTLRADVRFFGGIAVAVELDAAVSEDFRLGYAVDPLTGIDEDHDAWPGSLPPPPDEITEATRGRLGAAVEEILRFAHGRHRGRMIEEISDRAVRKALSGLDEGAPIPPEVLDDLAYDVAVNFTRHMMRTDWEDHDPELEEHLNRRKP
ncbi:HNH endonuclease [Sorangium sp. So ce291]|uniref:HNH endonuclease n=1 Tax=Sorangium sp. So ce291 TaxID=3133294 RepID=UPI003F61043E